MNFNHDELVISSDKTLLQIETICGFLERSYWADKRPESVIRQSIENSVCFGVYHADKQVGFARLITDGATMYWLCDVYIDEAYRGHGIGKVLVKTITTSDPFRNLSGILGTRDAHELYEQFGFSRDASRFMGRMPDYKRNGVN